MNSEWYSPLLGPEVLHGRTKTEQWYMHALELEHEYKTSRTCVKICVCKNVCIEICVCLVGRDVHMYVHTHIYK